MFHSYQRFHRFVLLRQSAWDIYYKIQNAQKMGRFRSKLLLCYCQSLLLCLTNTLAYYVHFLYVD